MAITHIDHVLIAVPQLAGAAETWSRLGFHITGGGNHPGRGTANKLSILDPEYLELITVTNAGEAWPDLVSYLQRFGGGLYTFALASDDIEADWAAFRSRNGAGLEIAEIWEGALVTPSGVRRGWRAARVHGGAAPNPFLIQHDSDGEEKRMRLAGDGELQAHPGGARSIHRLTFAFPSLEEARRYLQEGYGLEPEGAPSVCPSRQADRIFFPLRSGQIEAIAPQSAASPVAAFVQAHGYGVHSMAINVADTAEAATLLEAHGIKVDRRPNGSLQINPADTGGVRLTLVQDSTK